MLPQTLHDFLLASVGASASFIGLLFIAVTFVLDQAGDNKAVSDRDRIMAETSYTALLAIFFMSLSGLLPGGNVTWVMLVFGVLGGLYSARMFRVLRKKHYPGGHSLFFALLAVIYAVIGVYAIYLLANAGHALSLGAFYTIIFSLYAIGLGRAWALTGFDEE